MESRSYDRQTRNLQNFAQFLDGRQYTKSSTIGVAFRCRRAVGLLASTEKSARTVVLDDPGPCGCRSIPGGLKLKLQVERLHPKCEPVPRCCMSDWHGKTQIHEDQEGATNSGSMHPMK